MIWKWIGANISRVQSAVSCGHPDGKDLDFWPLLEKSKYSLYQSSGDKVVMFMRRYGGLEMVSVCPPKFICWKHGPQCGDIESGGTFNRWELGKSLGYCFWKEILPLLVSWSEWVPVRMGCYKNSEVSCVLGLFCMCPFSFLLLYRVVIWPREPSLKVKQMRWPNLGLAASQIMSSINLFLKIKYLVSGIVL